MKRIKLTKGSFVIVDDDDFEKLNQLKWHLSDTGYAVRRIQMRDNLLGGVFSVTIRMHRLIMNTPEHLFCDHINRCRLDNRKKNLRNVSWSENRQNLSKHKDNLHGEKNIDFVKNRNVYRVRIQRRGRMLFNQGYETLKQAVHARNRFEKNYVS